MARIVTFNNRTVFEPGVYARVLGAVEAPIEEASFGNLLFIDTGNHSDQYGYGAGVNGELSQNQVYQFNNANDFKNAVGGGLLWDLVTYLFKPSSDNRVRGISSLFYIRAATTVAPLVSFTFTGGGTNGGILAFNSKVEGIAGNGVASGANSSLSRGFSALMVGGVLDTSKFKIQFKRGTYRGLDDTVTPNELYNGIAEGDTEPEIILETPEFSNVQEVIDWANVNTEFGNWFSLDSTTGVAGTGVVDAADLTANATEKLFSGGTQTFATQDLTDALEAVTELDYTFVMCDRFGSDATASQISAIYSHIENNARFEKFLVVGGGRDADTFNDPTDTVTPDHSAQIAGFYDSSKVYVVHSDIFRANFNGSAARRYNVLYHAAMVAGRNAGLAPQVPTVWAELDLLYPVHELSRNERQIAIQSGVTHLRNVPQRGGFVINDDINTRQENSQDIYGDGTSPHGSIMRIISLLNKELILNLESNFIAGANVNVANPLDVKNYIERYLRDRTAAPNEDDLIISYQNVAVTLQGSDYTVSYAFVPNGPVKRFFVTGFLLPISL